jgi:hypothetical protein
MSLNTINTAYVIGVLFILAVSGFNFAFWMFILAAMIATIPFATSIYFVIAPIFILIWCFFFTSSDVYDSDFAWLSIIYAPFFYTSALSFVVDGIKSIIGSR